MSLVRPIDFLVGDVKDALGGGRPCTLLIGAGCSVTAGIPTAAGFVEQIKDEYGHRYELAPAKTYADCMAELDRGQRDRLIAKNISNATINLAHLAIASLVSRGCVDRVLTTNFDPLVVRACALLSQFPAVYDCAASDGINPRQIGGQAVFCLHGQHRGPILINTPRDLDRNAERVRPVIEDALQRGGILIVVGYSGADDPVFDALVEPEEFRDPVFWVSYEDNAPPEHVSERLLVEKKGAYQIEGYDADGFFVALAQELEAFPPDLLRRPFSHLTACLDPLPRQCRLPGRDDPIQIGADARSWAQQAVRLFEDGNLGTLDSIRDTLEPERRVAEAEALLLAGKHEELARLHQRYEGEPPPRLADIFARGYFKWGLALHDRGEEAQGGEAQQLLSQACEKYGAALEIKRDYHVALNNWGLALREQADLEEGEEAERLLQEACEKYEAAVKMKPEDHVTPNNWSFALLRRGARQRGAEADDLFRSAKEKALAAEANRPGAGAYNAACACARLGEEGECRKWLEIAFEHGTVRRRSHMEKDPDFESVRDTDWFKEMLEKAPG